MAIKEETKKENKYTIKSVKKALLILDYISMNGPVSLTDVFANANMSKSECFRILYTLKDDRLIEQDENTYSYRIGIKAYVIGQKAVSSLRLSNTSENICEELASASGESVHISLRSNDLRVCIMGAESPNLIRHYVALGEILPLYAGSGGKVILAFFGDDEIKEYLKRNSLKEIGIGTITNEENLIAECREIREKGYSYSEMELSSDGASISAPIRNHLGKVIASISISGPKYRFKTIDEAKLVELITNAAKVISKQSGYIGKCLG